MAKYTHIFEKPWTYENVTYEKMEFDFNKLTGDDLIGIEAEMDAEGNPLVIPDFYLFKSLIRFPWSMDARK